MDAILRGKPSGPAHNLFLDLGPQCPTCSGLGKVLQLIPKVRVRDVSKCQRCDGTGVDFRQVMRREIDLLTERMAAMELAFQKALRIGSLPPPDILNSRQGWMEMIAWATADGTAVANTTTEAILFPNVTIPANYMQDGRALRATLRGRWGKVTATTPTLTFAVRWGGVAGTIIMQSGANSLASTVQTNAMWKMDFEIQTRANGATGSVMAMGDGTLWTATVPTQGTVTNYGMPFQMGSAGVATPAAVTVDLTADTALAITADWSAADAANTIQGINYLLESMN